MPIPEIDPSESFEALADAELQQELRSLFAIDTQTYLQKYSQIVQSLKPDSWRADVQEVYRCIHTIKGGAVTVGAEAVLHTATALEDVLSDLRYLEQVPPLSDGYLSQVLLEAGELLTGTLESKRSGGIEPILNRIHTLHQEIRQRYLPQWNETSQMHQEFAEQGVDLVVLELEIALEHLPEQGNVPDAALQTARNTLEQLTQIGTELQLEAGWTELLSQAQTLLEQPTNAVWRSQWMPLFQALKVCAKQGGKSVPFEFPAVADASANGQVVESLPSLTIEDWVIEDVGQPRPEQVSQSPLFASIPDLTLNSEAIAPDTELSGFLGIHSFDDLAFDDLGHSFEDFDSPAIADPILSGADPILSDDLWTDSRVEDSASQTPAEHIDWLEPSPDNEAESWLDPLPLIDLVAESRPPIVELPPPVSEESIAVDADLPQLPALPRLNSSAQLERTVETTEKVQIPVPLEKLDQSADHIVETLISLRATQGAYQTLQSQLVQLVALAQEGAEHITHLRQIQDDYTLLEELRNSAQSPSQGPTPERYRQGYTVINRLLETSLRLSEIGAETGKMTTQVAEYLRDINNNVLKLQTTIEGSRLVPFRDLGFRARAILRDLTIRYDKPAQLIIQGEQTELDVSIARKLEPVLLHLIRNAYDHGLESPAERSSQGKSEQGHITLSLQQQGNQFQFEIRDDGRGIDAKTIHARAVALGLPLTHSQTSAELLAIICQPGFSVQSQVNEISGRGIGMDVVAAQVARLGGQLSLETTPTVGTTFRLQFPVPRLLVPCVLLQSGNRTFAVLDDDIRTIRLWSDVNALPVEEANQLYSWRIQDDIGSLPAIDLLEYWQQRSTQRALSDTTICLHIAATEKQSGIWLLADELLEQAELIINPLPSLLTAPGGLIGLSLQPDGSLIPVLQARDLAEYLLDVPIASLETASNTPATGEADELPVSILVVDDAALMRRRLESSLNTYGYLTNTCADGQEAWNWLQTNPHPSMIITDIEMPNMDGFTLIDRCRQAGITIPILVISSRLSEEWFDEAKRLGATDYLTKGFSTIELIRKTSTLLTEGHQMASPVESLDLQR